MIFVKPYRATLLLIGMIAGLMMLSFVCMAIGPTSISFKQTVKILWHALFGSSPSYQGIAGRIILSIRLPRVILGALIGASLAVAGSVFQALIRNPLGDPYILGVSSGAVLGSVIGFSLGMGATFFGAQLSSFVGALLAIAIVYKVASIGGKIHTTRLILAGVIISAFFSAIAMFTFSVSESSTVKGILFWMMGDLSSQSLGNVAAAAPSLIIGMVLLYLFSGKLNLIMVSEENALQLGVEVERVKKASFLLCSFITGAAVAVSGAIGFIGLVVPNMVRFLWGSDLRLHIPLSAISGAALLMVSDTLARTLMAPAEMPVGVITAAIGAPLFIFLLKGRV
jgi:iron complex transport system permease protein